LFSLPMCNNFCVNLTNIFSYVFVFQSSLTLFN